jgi:DNA primase
VSPGMFADGTVEQVKEAADIIEVISAHTELRRSGERWTGLCPFHEERSPSFSVDAHQGLYHCFGCGVGGDIIKFVSEMDALSFPEAVESLADRFGVEIKREELDPQAEERRKRRVRLGELLERTGEFYTSFLHDSPKAAKARDYLDSRGLGQEILDSFGVGFAPKPWDTVLLRGQRAGYSVDELIRAGLVKKNSKGNAYDHFRGRITFPIRDARGNVQGFGARAMEPGEKAKYINSPEGELYRKSRTLFGIDHARGAITKRGRAVVVEGYTDVLAAHQAGITETVAVMGTAITPEQLKLLARDTEEVILALDADRAGREAMLRARRVAGASKLSLRVAAMPAGEDPADILQGARQGDDRAKRMEELIAGAVEMTTFHVRKVLDEADLSSPAGRDRALDEVVPVLAGMGETITRDELEAAVAKRLDADLELVRRRVRGGHPPAESTPAPVQSRPKTAAARVLGERERRERRLLAMCVAEPELGREFLERIKDLSLSSPLAQRGRAWLEEHLEDPARDLPRDDDELVSLVVEAVTESEREPANRDSMEFHLLGILLAATDDEIADAPESELPALQRRRGEFKERMARFRAPGPGALVKSSPG